MPLEHNVKNIPNTGTYSPKEIPIVAVTSPVLPLCVFLYLINYNVCHVMKIL